MPWRAPAKWPKFRRARESSVQAAGDDERAQVDDRWRPHEATPRSSWQMYLLVGVFFLLAALVAHGLAAGDRFFQQSPKTAAVIIGGVGAVALLQAFRVRGQVAAFFSVDDDVVDVHTAELIGRALGTTTLAEIDLVRGLQHDDLVVRRASAYALGKIGTIGSVPSLQSSARGFFTDQQLKISAQRAIGEIRDRGPNAKPAPLKVEL